MKPYTFTDDKAKLGTRIEELGKVSAIIGKNVHTTLVGVLMHAYDHGECSLLVKLDDAISGAMHKTGLRRFAEAKGCVRWVKADKAKGVKGGFVIDAGKRVKMKPLVEADRPMYIGSLLSKTYWEFAPQKEYEGFSFISQLMALVTRAAKIQADETKATDAKTDLTGLAEADALIKTLTDGAKLKPTASAAKPKTKGNGKTKAKTVIALPDLTSAENNQETGTEPLRASN